VGRGGAIRGDLPRPSGNQGPGASHREPGTPGGRGSQFMSDFPESSSRPRSVLLAAEKHEGRVQARVQRPGDHSVSQRRIPGKP
jgi:hypothetical protein